MLRYNVGMAVSFILHLARLLASLELIFEPCLLVGSVICLEPGCDGISIPLVRRVKASDGGRREGLGSLSAYRVNLFRVTNFRQLKLSSPQSHIVEHPAHPKDRHAPVKTEVIGAVEERENHAVCGATDFHRPSAYQYRCYTAVRLATPRQERAVEPSSHPRLRFIFYFSSPQPD